MTQFSDEAIDRIMTAAVQRTTGDVSIVDLISLSSMYNKVYGQSSRASSAMVAGDSGIEVAWVSTPGSDDEDQASIEEEGARNREADASPAASSWTAAALLVWSVYMASWSAISTVATTFMAFLARAQTVFLAAFDDGDVPDAEDDREHRESGDDATTVKILRFLVNLLHAKANERDAVDDIVYASARHTAAQEEFKAVLAEWPVVQVDERTSSRVLSLYADVSVAVDAVATAEEANRGQTCEYLALRASNDDISVWV